MGEDMSYQSYLVWTNYGSEGWKPTGATTFDAAVEEWQRAKANGNSEVIITEYIPLKIEDGRKPSTVPVHLPGHGPGVRPRAAKLTDQRDEYSRTTGPYEK